MTSWCDAQVALSTAELTVAERHEAEDFKRAGDELRSQVIVRSSYALRTLFVTHFFRS